MEVLVDRQPEPLASNVSLFGYMAVVVIAVAVIEGRSEWRIEHPRGRRATPLPCSVRDYLPCCFVCHSRWHLARLWRDGWRPGVGG
jgi:hypothetical protein